MTGFLPGLLTPLRLWLGALLCLVPLGLIWAFTPGGALVQGIPYCQSDPTAPFPYPPYYPYLCVPTYIGVQPGSPVLGAQAPARVMLIFAALILVFAAVRWRTEFTKRLVQAATAAIAIAAAFALSDRTWLPFFLLLAALVLVGPLVLLRRPRRPSAQSTSQSVHTVGPRGVP